MEFKSLLFFFLFGAMAMEGQNAGRNRKSKELFPDDCGMQKFRSGRRTTRIVNGNDASFGEYPWQVVIYRDTSRFYCSGVLINSRWIVTAAHCVHRSSFFRLRFTFWLGDHDRSHDNEPMKSIVKYPEEIFIHPKYDPKKNDFDIAMVKFSTPVEFKPHIQPICLPDAMEDESIVGKFATVTGWGSIYDQEKNSDILQEVSVPVVRRSYCSRVFQAKDRAFNSERSICTGFPDGKRSACNGDSGGPLQFERANGRWVMIGLVSWSVKPCAEKYHLDAFTRVSSYVPWMRRVMWQNYDEEEQGEGT